MRQVGREDVSLDAQVGSLSIATQQLVEIARAVANDCRVLVFDEPTSSLAQSDIVRLFELIRQLKSRGHAIVYISHFLEEVKEISDTFTVLRDGQSVGVGKTSEISSKEIISMMVGRHVEDLYPRSPRVRGEAILEITDLAGLRKPRSASWVLTRSGLAYRL